MAVPGRDGKSGTNLENIFYNIIHENFPNLAREANIQIQEMQRTPVRYSMRRLFPRHIIIRLSKVKVKEKNVKGSQRERSSQLQRETIRLTAELSVETLQTRKDWRQIFNILKEKKFQPRISCPDKLNFISKGEIRSFSERQMQREFVTITPTLQGS